MLAKLDEEYKEKMDALKDVLIDKLMTLTNGKTSQGVKDYLGIEVIPKGAKFTQKSLAEIDYTAIQVSKWTTDAAKNDLIRATIMNYLKKFGKEYDAELRRQKFDISIGDELPSGIVQMAKVYIAKKRKISVGDKMAGRHRKQGYCVACGTSGRCCRSSKDGTPVDIVLNPLGVPSRMNLGRDFRNGSRLGRCKIGRKIRYPHFRWCFTRRLERMDR